MTSPATNPTRQPVPAADPARLLDEFVAGTTGVIGGVLLSADGLPIAASRLLSREQVERTAALASSLIALGNAVAREFDGGAFEINILQTARFYYLYRNVGEHGGLALFAERTCRLAVVGDALHHLASAVWPFVAVGDPAAAALAAPGDSR